MSQRRHVCNEIVTFAAVVVVALGVLVSARLYDRRLRVFIVRYVNARIAGGDRG